MDASFIHGPDVRTALRFVSGAELAGAFAAADLVVLPYREIDQSGVLFTALAFGKPLLLSAVGGFPEIDGRRARPARRRARARGRADRAARPTRHELARMAAASRALAAGPYGWDGIAAAHAGALRGPPGVDHVIALGRALLARRDPLLARCRGTPSARRPASRARCPRG